MSEACINCGKAASFLCSRCAERYCSSRCQIMNWSTHKSTCFSIPYLVPMPKTDSEDTLYIQNGAVCVKGILKVSESSNHDSVNEVQLLSTDKENKIPLMDGVPKQVDSTKASNTTTKQDAKAVLPSAAMNNGWMKGHVPPMKETFSVMVQWVDNLEPTLAWVTQMQHEQALEKLKASMQTAIKNQSIPINPSEIKVGALVAVAHKGQFYRAKVLGIKSASQTATLRLIDYGKIATPVPFNELCSVVAELQKENAYAFRVRVPKDVVPLTVSAILTVRTVTPPTPEGIYVVEVKPESMPRTLPMEFLNMRTGVVLKKIFPDGKHGLIQLDLPCKSREMSAILQSEQASKYLFTSAPAKGAFVAARTTVGWFRAILLGSPEQSLHLVYIVDEGKVRFTTEIKKVPREYVKQPARVLLISNSEGMLMSLKNYLDSKKKIPLKFSSNITEMKNIQDVMCSLGESEVAVKASCFPTTDDQLDIQYWIESISDQNVVVITAVETFAEIQIAPYQTKKYENYFAEISKQCQPYGKEEAISRGDIVLVKCDTSGSYFRGEILIVHRNKNDVKVVNLDTGVPKLSTRRNLWKANSFVRFCPVYTQKVKLSFLDGMRTIFANNKALGLLKEHQTNSTEFVVKFHSDDKSAELFYRSGANESLNKKLLPLVFEGDEAGVPEPSIAPTQSSKVDSAHHSAADDVPSSTTITDTPAKVEQTPPTAAVPKDGEAVKTKVFFDDIEVIPMTTGDDIEIYVLDSSMLYTSHLVTACNYNRENVQLMKKCMETTNKYCKGPDAVRGYAPEPSEICFANFAEDGNWYRAVCIRCVDHKYEIMFFDFGNITKVSQNDLVKMPMTKEFMFASLANMVSFADCPKEKIVDCAKKIMENPIYKCKLIKSQKDEDAYNIVF